ncbi:MAG: IS630 family transposase [Candidatus Thorarchaeota archaeon]|jgi:putative transposase
MIYAQVNDKGFELLKAELKTTKDAKWYRRVKIIQLSSQGQAVSQLAMTFDLCQVTIRDYIKRYNKGGLESLKRRNSNGRPPKIKLTKAEWEELLHRSPCQFEKLDTAARNWTRKLLAQYCSAYLDVQITEAAISILLKRLGIKWNRGKLKITSPDPLYIVKRERVETLKEKAQAGTLSSHDATDADQSLPPKPGHLAFFDATDLHWCPDVGNGYAPKGEQIKVDSPGKENPWCALFGSLLYPTGEGLYTIHERKRHEEVQTHLELLIQGDPDAFWFVVLDNASAHTTPMLDSFREQYRQSMEFVFQPTYSPHLNLIEKLWWLMRKQMTKNQFYQCLKILCEAIVEWLEKLPFSQFCSLMGIDEDDLVFVEN